MAKTIALIPARSGSKGIKNKNLATLGGHTLLDWSITACINSKLIDRVIVSTDNDEYAKHCLSLGAEVPFLRPAEISNDKSTDYEFIIHAINHLEKNRQEIDLIAHIRPTSPFRDPQLIDEAIEIFARTTGFTSLRSVHEMSESSYKTFEVMEQGILKSVAESSTAIDVANAPRQAFPKTYSANGYIDILSKDYIKKTNCIHGDKAKAFVTPRTNEVDDIEDLKLLEYELIVHPEYSDRIFARG